MTLRKRLRTIFVCAALELGVLSGVPMRPEEIRALLHQINQPKLAHTLPADEESSDDPPAAGSMNEGGGSGSLGRAGHRAHGGHPF